MPGIVGVARVDGAPASVDAALARLLHAPGLATASFAADPRVGLGSVHRARRAPALVHHGDDGRGVTVIVAGTILSARGAMRRLDARDVADLYVEHGLSRFSDLDGAFVVAILDRARHRLVVQNDRLGELPLYWAEGPSAIAFGPEVKAVVPLVDIAPGLSETGVASFLAAGYCLGETTLFEGVRMLEPGSRLTIDLRPLRARVERVSAMRYAPDPALARRGAAEEALHAAILDAHRLVLCDRPARCDLMLSGGWDSRGMLGALEAIGARPARALCFGERRDVPRSDPMIAAEIARDHGVKFCFAALDADSFLEHAERWLWMSELANDNFGWSSSGTGAVAALFDPDAAFTLVGDELWGWEGTAGSEAEARSTVLPATLPAALAGAIRPGRAREIEALWAAQIDRVLAPSAARDWDDRKDFLYAHGRLARFIFPLGWGKEHVTEVRRPFLASAVLDVVQRLPAGYRIHKNLYRSMLAQKMPRVMRAPGDAADSLPDWEYDLAARPPLRARMRALLDEDRLSASPLRELLDPGRVAAMRDAWLARPRRSLPRAPSPGERIKDALMQRLAPHRGVTQALCACKRALTGPPRMRSFDLLRRLALLVLLIERLPDLRRYDARRADVGSPARR